MSTQGYTIYLLKEQINSFEAALDPEKNVFRHNIVNNAGVVGALFVGDQNQSQPGWVALLNPFLNPPVQRALSANISAVLLVSYENRIFATTFGHGKSLLAASSWVRDFGLKVTLNRVDPGKLRSVDSKTYEDMVLSTRTQASRSSTVDNFELDVARDLVRGVTGDSMDTTFFKRLTGSDVISLTTELPFEDFSDLLDELLVAYSETKYRANFGWIDNVREVDSGIRQGLDTELVAALRSGDSTNMHFAPTEIIEWETLAGFNYTGGKRTITYPELEIQDYFQVLGDDLKSLTLDQLRRHKIKLRLEDSDILHDQWSVYECLVWETESKGKKFALFDGRWFEIDKSYASRITNFVNSVSAVSIPLPDGVLGEDEGRYNEGVAIGDPKQFALLDRQPVRAEGATSPIEFCDLMSRSGHLIHVKKRSASATLSHLFSQASVSSDAFLSDAGVRREIRSKLKKLGKPDHRKLIPTQRPVPSDYEIVYAVLAKNGTKWPPSLPFFSAVNLMHHASRIRNLGFKVSLQHIKQM